MLKSSKLLLRLCAAGGVSLALLIGAASAVAAKSPQGPITVTAPRIEPDALSERVSYTDLNLASVSGAARLHGRVSRAVSNVCVPFGEAGMRIDYRGCTSFAWNGARPQMDLAIARAKEIAATGSSSIAAVAITISAPSR